MWDAIIITPFVNILLFIYTVFFKDFGLAIIIFTILIRLVTYPLFAQQMKGTAAMQDLQKDKRYLEMQEKYKGDKEKLAQEQMKLYRELGINPFASCLPTLIQFPIIIGLYQSITSTLASTPLDMLSLARHIYPWLISFISKIPLIGVDTLIPLNSRFLWMADLSQPERLSVLGIEIPVLAIIVVISTYMQSKVMTPPTTNPNDQSAGMMKAMNLYMPFFMGWLALTLSAGLSVYFVASNVIGIVQYMLMGKANWHNLLPSFKMPSLGSLTGQSTVRAKPDRIAYPPVKNDSNKGATLRSSSSKPAPKPATSNKNLPPIKPKRKKQP
jgi:YidC/Oxa1 family membrane protein insertase